MTVLIGYPAPSHATERANVTPLSVRTQHSGFNRLVVSITVCAPNSDRCATVDDVMVDTGSTGLRLEASAVPAWLRLPSFLGPTGKPLAECLRFVHDTAWGALHQGDVRLGGIIARASPLQVIDDVGGPQAAACPRSDVRATSNGTLGVGQHLYDCQGTCEQRADAPGFFVEDGTTWFPLQRPVESTYRLPNAVLFLPGYDNGIVIDLPSPPDGAAREVIGTLTFGVGTVEDNQLRTSSVLRLDTAGRFTTEFLGRAYPASYIDSGTETYILHDDGLPRCRELVSAYCVDPRRSLDAEMVGTDEKRMPVAFTVGSYRTAAGVSDDVAIGAEPQSGAFVWGAPFFLGKRIALVLDGKGVPGSPGLTGPFYGLDWCHWDA